MPFYSKLPGVAAEFFVELFLVVDGIVTMITIVTPFTVIFKAAMIIVSRRRIIVLRMINARTILVVSSRRIQQTWSGGGQMFVSMTNLQNYYDDYDKHQLHIQGTSNLCWWAVVARTDVDVKPILVWGSKAKVRTIEILENAKQSIDLHLDCCY